VHILQTTHFLCNTGMVLNSSSAARVLSSPTINCAQTQYTQSESGFTRV
jgi:hypothetical protein